MIIKESSYGNKRGLLDPAVFARTRAKKIYPDTSLYQPVDLAQIDFMALRESMGAENRDLTTEKINTRNILIPCNDHYITAQITKTASLKTVKHCCVYLHGGGFIGGSAQKLQNQSKLLAERSEAMVISLNYRLAPETIFPGAVEDVVAAISWICKNHYQLGFSDSRVLVMGDSAGGNLAVVAGQQLTKKYISHLVTLYGAFDLTPVDQGICHWSYEDFVINPQHEKLIHSRINKIGYLNHIVRQLYVNNQTEVMDSRVSPVVGNYDSDFPDITLIEAEFDFCLPSNNYLVKKLKTSGVNVDIIFYLGLDHGFYDRLGYLAQAEDCLNSMAEIIKKV